jgi:dihydrofolate synthase / folylpolyglutamate synthase
MKKITTFPGITWLENLPPWDGKNFSPLEVPRQILSHVSDPQNSYKTIHIAGTNGKGSVAHCMSAILELEYPDDKIGLLTSPHLITIEERGKINSKNCSTQTLSECLLEIKKACEAIHVTPTYFVAITCALFLLFKKENVKYAIIEAGLGGRYDATNVLKTPELCIITTIGMDHEEQLGTTFKEIAWNKGGIIKKNVPLLYGSLPTEAENELIALCNEQVTSYQRIDQDSFSWCLNLHTDIYFLEKSYQVHNFILSAQAASILKCSRINILNALSKIKIKGRLDYIPGKTPGVNDLLFDCAHNPEGIKALIEYTLNLSKKNAYTHIFFLFSFLARKNWKECLSVLQSSLADFPLTYSIQWTSFSNESIAPKTLQEFFNGGAIIKNIDSALKEHSQREEKTILICAGSILFIADAYRYSMK